MKTVYADVVFITNFCIDYLMLFLSSCFLHIKIPSARMIMSSLFGGAYALFVLVVSPCAAVRVITLFASLIIMCYIAFGKRRIRTFTKILVLMSFFSILLGGMITMLVSTVTSGFQMMLLLLIFGTIVTFAIKLLRPNYITQKVRVKILKGCKECVLSLLCDSGNLVVDPYNSLPVILLDGKCKNELLESTDLSMPNSATRLVPIKTVSGSSLIEVLTPDAVIICSGTNKRVEASVGFVRKELFLSDEYDGIIPNILIQNL